MSEKKVPERRCIGCMQSKPKKELLRIVADEDGLHIDKSGKMPGRGAYLCRNGECAQLAVKKNAFGRNLKVEVTRQQAESLAEQIAQLCR
ncbi:MAG: YlxR family protein [Firmicutes bacterium]|nr:YlxR family protein [Bacillota bacterium]